MKGGASRDEDLDRIDGESVIGDCVTQRLHSISSGSKKELDKNSPLSYEDPINPLYVRPYIYMCKFLTALKSKSLTKF